MLYKYKMYNMETPKKYIQLAGTVTVGPKGQVVIPSEVREKMQIKPGDKLVALYIPSKQSVGFVPEAQVQRLIDKMGANIVDLKTTIK